jgi:cytoskeleton protein RodZ
MIKGVAIGKRSMRKPIDDSMPLFPRRGAVARETRMRRERARFLDRRERRANDESSPFSALGENGRGFDAIAPSPLLTLPQDWPTIFSMASLGQELRRERELRGISLQEIADSTRISLRFLQAIEEDRFDRISGEFFVRAILRSYAKSIGLDEHQVLNRYQEMQSYEEQHQDKENKNVTPPRKLPPMQSRRHKKFVAVAIAAIAVIAVGLALLYIFSPSSGKEPPILQETTLPASLSVEMPEPPAAEAEAESVRELRLRMDFIEETWLRVIADGESVWDGIKTTGESLEVMAEREVFLNLGNAGGFGLTINGLAARPLGPRGAVRQEIRITPENYRDFLASENPSED